MIEERYECDENMNWDIKHGSFGWYIATNVNIGTCMYVKYCPFCGEKLE